MCEHVVRDVNKNNDGFVSYDEFIGVTTEPEYEKPPEEKWEPIDDVQREYTVLRDEEFEEYKKQFEDYEEESHPSQAESHNEVPATHDETAAE